MIYLNYLLLIYFSLFRSFCTCFTCKDAAAVSSLAALLTVAKSEQCLNLLLLWMAKVRLRLTAHE